MSVEARLADISATLDREQVLVDALEAELRSIAEGLRHIDLQRCHSK